MDYATLLATNAPLYMDIVTLFFALLPFLLFVGIRFAIKGDYESHFRWQVLIYVTTLVMVVVFEIGVRVSGGLMAFMKASQINETFIFVFTGFHVLIALVSVVLWSALIYGGIKHYRIEKQPLGASHKRFGRYVFLGISITSLMGVMIYYFLFVMH